MSGISDETLLAYLDDELDLAERRRVEAALGTQPDLRARLEAHRGLSEAARRAFAEVLSEPMPMRLVAAVRRKPSRRVFKPYGWAAMAACLVAGVLIGRLTPVDPPVFQAGLSGLIAEGRLAEALETAPSAGAGPVRIGLSFRSAESYCRTFEMTAERTAGLACREAGAWRVRVAAESPRAAGDYRMAASGAPPAVLQAVDALIVGAPLDRAQEDKARLSGWR